MSDLEFTVKVRTGYNSTPRELELLHELGIDRYQPYQIMTFTDSQLAKIFYFSRLELNGFEIKITIGAF